MDFIDEIAGLEALYGAASVGSQRKVAAHLTPSYRRWIEASRFCIVSTIGAGGTDGSPRGDDGPVVRVLDPKTLAMPDWRGNNRLDSLRNIVTDGRVSRLLVAPILSAMAKVLGPREYLDFISDFRYPLAGEFAMRTSILPDMRIPSDWGLEIGLLSEAWRNLSPRSVCQVEVSDRYDHKHQVLSEEDATAGLSRMSVDICKALYRKLAADGTVFSEEIFRSIKATYFRDALDLIETYFNDAQMNGLHVDRHVEEKTVELFASNIMRAGQVFLDNPMETPFIPNWSRVHAADPDITTSMIQAVAEDMKEYSEAV